MAPVPEQLASWPSWTDATVGTTAVDVQIAWSVDETFDKLWGPSSEFSVSFSVFDTVADYRTRLRQLSNRGALLWVCRLMFARHATSRTTLRAPG